jgi:peptide chain release factor 3
VASFRLKNEYGVECGFEAIGIATARWVRAKDAKLLEQFKTRLNANLALDHAGELVLLAPTQVSLRLTTERWPDVELNATREHSLG